MLAEHDIVLIMRNLTWLLLAFTPFLAMGKDVVVDSFGSSKLDPAWKVLKGKWEIKDGALTGSELTEDKHNAVIRHALGIRNGKIALSIRLDGAKSAHVNINQKGGHLFRLILTPAGVTLQKDKPNATSEEKAEVLAKSPMPMAIGVWHTVEIEMQGSKVTALIDGKLKLEGDNKKLDVEKVDFGFPVGGVSASYDNVKVTSD